jgi:hypothetical protein
MIVTPGLRRLRRNPLFDSLSQPISPPEMDLGVKRITFFDVFAILIKRANDRVRIIRFDRVVRKVERVCPHAQVFEPFRDIGNREGSNAAPRKYIKQQEPFRWAVFSPIHG